MRFLRVSCVLALLAGVPAPAAGPAPAALPIGDVMVSLGDAEAELMPRLRERFELVELRPGLYQASLKGRKTDVAGIVQFRDGKLVWASRDLGAYEGESTRNFGRALFQALENAKSEMARPITLVTQREGTPEYSVGVITFKFPDRQLVLYVGRDGGAVDLSMEEILAPEDDAGVEARAAMGETTRTAGEAR
jgi:hypothetical protein